MNPNRAISRVSGGLETSKLKFIYLSNDDDNVKTSETRMNVLIEDPTGGTNSK